MDAKTQGVSARLNSPNPPAEVEKDGLLKKPKNVTSVEQGGAKMDAQTQGVPARPNPPNPPGGVEKDGVLERIKDVSSVAKWVAKLLGFVLGSSVPSILAANHVETGNKDFNLILSVAIATWPLTAVITGLVVAFFNGWRPSYGGFLLSSGIALFIPAYFGCSIGLGKDLTLADLANWLGKDHLHPVMLPLAILGFYCHLYGWPSFIASFIVAIFFAWAWKRVAT